LPHGRLYVNKGKAPEIYYDSNQEPVILQPGEAKFEQIIGDMDIGKYFLSPELWNAQKDMEEIIATKGHLSVLVERTIHGIGDQLLITTIPRAYHEALGDKVTVDVLTAPEYVCVWENNPHVRKVYTERPAQEYDVNLDVNNVDLKCEPKDWEERNRRNRTLIFLEQLGLHLIDRAPVYVVSKSEESWAVRQMKGVQRPCAGLQRHSSVKSRTYPHMEKVRKILKERGWGTIVLDEKIGASGKYKYSFREMAALVQQCDVIVSPDSSVLHLAGALRKRVVGVFGYTEGSIFTEDYEKATYVQAPCPHGKSPCWWTIDCLPGSTTQEKEDVDYVDCLKKLKPSLVADAVLNSGTKVKKVLVAMLTYNLLEWTAKAMDSIRSFHDYDIFVVDNESTDGTAEWLKTRGVEFVSKKSSVAEAQNIAIAKFLQGDWDYLILLNNDLVLRFDTIDKLVECAEKTKGWGIMATPLDSCAPWLVDEAKTEVGYEEIRDIPAGSYSCTIFSRECLEKVGFFDERFAPRYIEDNDYTLRIRLAGGKFLRSRDAVYYHALGGVVKTNEEERRNKDKNWHKNIRLYTEKWGIHPHEPQSLEKLGLEHTRSVTLSSIRSFVKSNGRARVLVERRMGGYGDILFITVVARELKKAVGRKKVHVTYAVPSDFTNLLKTYPYIDTVKDFNQKVGKYDFKIDLTDLEFRVELQEISKHGEVKTPRSKIYLDVLGIKGNIKPEYFPTKEELRWAEAEWGKSGGDHRIVVVLKGSNKLKEWSGMAKVAELLRRSGQNVKVLDKGGAYAYTFREACALVAKADAVVSPDSGISNVAAALDVPTVTIFSNRNGKIFAEMFKSMIPLQGNCPYLKEGYCDFKVPCFGTGPHRAKENIDIPACLKGLSVDRVYGEVQKVIRGEVNK